jgi:hypothetical protein
MKPVTHKEYSIEVVGIDAEPKMWSAHIRRLDGAKIKVVADADGGIHHKVVMPPEFSADKAIEQAKKSINVGAFSKAPVEDEEE